MHPQLRIIFVAVTAVFAAVACSSIDNVSSAIQPAHAAAAPSAQVAAAAAPVQAVAVTATAVDPNRAVPYARPDLSPDPEERRLAAETQLAIAKLQFVKAQRLATTPALKEMVSEALKQYRSERNLELETNLAMLEQSRIRSND